MTNPKKKKTVETNPQAGEVVGINFGNIEALKLQLHNDGNKIARDTLAMLNKIDATLIRLEMKNDADRGV
jgi:hypothetical protein